MWRFARNHRAATIAIATTTVSPDERGSNSPRRKITLSRDTEQRGDEGVRRRRRREGWTGRERARRAVSLFSSPKSRRTYVKYRGSVAVCIAGEPAAKQARAVRRLREKSRMKVQKRLIC